MTNSSTLCARLKTAPTLQSCSANKTCSSLFQLIKLINSLKCDVNDNILNKIAEKSHSYNGFAFNVTRTIQDTYDPLCRIKLYCVCKSQ